MRLPSPGSVEPMPALLMSTQSSLSSRATSSASRRTSASDARSATYDPAAPTERAARSTRAGSRPCTSTRAPRPARSAASPRPRPSVAPVMSTALPSMVRAAMLGGAAQPQHLLARRRTGVQHAPAVAAGADEPGPAQDAEVLRPPRGRGAEPLREVLRGRRRAQRAEDRRAPAAEQRVERAGVGVVGRRPERPDAARGVDQRRLPRLVDHGEDLGPREDRRHEQQPAAAQVDLLVDEAVDLHRAVVPAHAAVKPGEDLDRPAHGQPPRAMDD